MIREVWHLTILGTGYGCVAIKVAAKKSRLRPAGLCMSTTSPEVKQAEALIGGGKKGMAIWARTNSRYSPLHELGLHGNKIGLEQLRLRKSSGELRYL